MNKESLENRWATYESNVQQYRVLSATVQSFLLAVGSILYTQNGVPNALLFLVTLLAVLHIRFIWFDVVRARHLIIDYYKFQHYSVLTEEQLTDLYTNYPETRYVHEKEAREKVNSEFFKRPTLKLWRQTRIKFDIVVPSGYFLIWAALFLWKQPWKLPLW
jgi:hypothetical protein